MRHRQLPALLVALALAGSVAGCTRAVAGSSTTTTQAITPRFEPSGTVVVAVPSLPTNFNPSSPQGANPVTAEVMEQVWPQTFVTDSQQATTTEPGFVEGAEVQSLSPFTVVYTLNPKAVWSDGTPIGLADFVYNWHEQLLWAPHLPDAGLAAGYQAISSITAANGGSSISVQFSHPYTEWESLFSDLVPAHIGERYGWTAGFEGFDPTHVVSGGPFEISSFTPGLQLVLSRNPHYWFTPANLAHIVLQVEPGTAALHDVEAGLVDIAQAPAGAPVEAAVADAAHEGLALTATTVAMPTLWQLCFNTTDDTVGSVEFRSGVEHALYLDEITADSAGLEDAAVQPYGSRLALGLGSASGPASSGSAAAGASGSSGSGIDGYDPTAALASFEAAGFVRAASGRLESSLTGQPVTVSLLVPAGIPAVTQAASVVQAELGAAGIDVVLDVVSLSSMLSNLLPSGTYQMALAPFLLTAFAAEQLPIYSGSVLPAATSPATVRGGPSSLKSDPGENVGQEPGASAAGVVTRDVFGYEDPVVTSDLEQALTNVNPTDDENLILAADARMWLDLPTIPLFQQPLDLVRDSNVLSVSESPTWAGIFWDAQDWAIQVRPVVVPTLVPSS